MNEILATYLNQKKSDKEKLTKENRDKILIEEGLYTKDYAPENATNEELKEYPYYDTAFYKCVAIEVTDQEFEEVLRYRKGDKTEDNSSNNYNGVAVVFQVIAVLIFIFGFIAGIILGNVETGYYRSKTEFRFEIALAYWVASFVSGMFFIAIAEALKLLTEIKNNIKK